MSKKKMRCGDQAPYRMIGHTALVILFFLFPLGALEAGVVFEIETKDHEGGSARTGTTEVQAQGRNLKMGIAAGSRGRDGTAIFRGDRREMVVVDHKDKTYMVIDQEALKAIAGQVGNAMSQVQEALKNVPEEQRAMVEKMMKEHMPQAETRASGPKTELRKTGERATHGGYPCVKYEVFTNGRKKRELWVTDWGNVEGGDEATAAFKEMAAFFKEMMDSISEMVGGDSDMFGAMGENPFIHFDEIDGFPVVTREFDEGGNLESESTLRSSRRRTLDPAEFEPPSGYKRRQML